MHKAGFVNIIGSPNVGKSTLINAILGQKLVITNAKAQTTRHRILGMLNADDYRLVVTFMIVTMLNSIVEEILLLIYLSFHFILLST